MTRSQVFLALSGYRSDGRSILEGTPLIGCQARLQMSRHVKVVGLSLVLAGHVPARVRSRTRPGEITCPNAEGTRACRTDPGQRARGCKLVDNFGQLLTPRSPIHLPSCDCIYGPLV